MVVVGRERCRPAARTVAVWEGELADDVGDASSHQRLVPAAGRRRASNRKHRRRQHRNCLRRIEAAFRFVR
jgi:hypothetical protein